MKEFILLMHGDAPHPEAAGAWDQYIASLKHHGLFEGGSSMGGGACYRTVEPAPDISRHLVGFIKIQARNIDHAREALAGNPVFESGGTIEIRELIAD